MQTAQLLQTRQTEYCPGNNTYSLLLNKRNEDEFFISIRRAFDFVAKDVKYIIKNVDENKEKLTNIKYETKKDLSTELATKADIQELKGEMNELKSKTQAQIEELRSNTQAQIEELRSNTQAQIEELRTNTQIQIEELKGNIQAQIEELSRSTQVQIEELKGEIKEFKAQIRAEVNELRGEIKEFKAQVQTQIEELKGHTQVQIEEIRGDLKTIKLMMKVLIGSIVIATTCYSPASIELVKFLSKIFLK